MITARSRTLAAVAAASLILLGCSAPTSGGSDGASTSAATHEVKIQDRRGDVTVKAPAQAAVVTDNKAFETLSEWGIAVKAAPKAIMPETIAYKKDNKVIDLGSHNEPKMESVVAAQPDVVINGMRFAKHYDEMKKLAPKAAIIDTDPKDGEKLDAHLKRLTTTLGQVFGKEKEADKINADFDAAVAEARAAYKPGDKVLAINVSGGKIGYIAPSKGRTLGPVYDLLGLTPALTIDNASDNHKGDEISVEAIAASNPDWILVMDRDAGTSDKNKPEYKPAETVLKESAALANVTAIKEGHVVYMPADTYTNDGIQTYTEFFKDLAKAFKK